LQEQI